MQVHKELELTRREPVLRYNYRFDLKKIKTNILNSTIASVMIFSSIAGTLPMLFSQKASATGTGTIVTPLNLLNWQKDTQVGGQVNFVSATGTNGDGALQLTTAENNASVASLYSKTDVPLSSISHLGYKTQQLAGPEASANPSYYMGIDANGQGNPSDEFYVLYETYYNGANHSNIWQPWDITSTTGKFWSKAPVGTSLGSNQGGSAARNFTLGELQAAYPNAHVLEYGLNMGTYNPGWKINVDDFNFNGTVYNFETNPIPTTVYVDPAYTINNAGSHTFGYDAFTNIQNAVDAVAANGTIDLEADIILGQQVNITKALTINGINHTIFASFAKTGYDNNSALGITAGGVTVNSLTVDGAGGQAYPKGLHGINVYRSNNINLNGVTSKNNTYSGINVNGSDVTVNTVTTSNNGWHGIDVDKSGAKLTINGVSHHGESGAVPQVYIDDTTTGASVVDTSSQYVSAHINLKGEHLNDLAYTLKPIPPTLTVTTPAENSVVSTVSNGNKLAIAGSFTDDIKANYAEFQLVKADTGSVALGIIYGFGSVYNPAANYADANGNYTYNMPVPANLASGDYSLFYTGTDFTGGVTARMERKFTIDNTAPIAPKITAPGARTWHNTTPILDSWTLVEDPSGVTYQVAYAYDDAHSFGGSTCPGEVIAGVSVYCRDTTITSRNHTPGITEEGGVTIWVRAIDGADNASPWSSSIHYFYDHTAPATTIAVDPLHSGVTGKIFAVNGDASDNLALNRVYVQLINKSTSARYGGTTVNLIPNGKTGHWNVSYNASSLNLPNGDYYAVATTTDMAGNSTTTDFLQFTIDNSPPVVSDNFNVSFQVGKQLTLSPIVTDNSTVDYRWQVSDSKLSVLNDPSTSLTGSTLTLGPSPNGVYSVALTVTDQAGNSTLKTYNVNVTLPPTAAPQATKPAINQSSPAIVKPTLSAPVTVTNVTTPQVLGATTTTPPAETGQVKGAETSSPSTTKLATIDSSTKKDANFLGLGWWWLAVVGAIVGFSLLFSRFLGTNKKA